MDGQEIRSAAGCGDECRDERPEAVKPSLPRRGIRNSDLLGPDGCYGDRVARWTSVERSWSDVSGFLASVDGLTGGDAYPIDIIDSVVSSGADAFLAIDTSMHDLVVAPRPVESEAETDVIVVCAPGSMRPHPAGTVRIDFDAANGQTTSIVRPSSEAVSLFWRFAETEFGMRRQSQPEH